MKLYMHPASTTSRPISLFAAESGIVLDEQVIDLMSGEHLGPDYLALNPNGMVPMLDDDGFRLTESSAILKYLAEKTGSPAYPTALRDRARVNEAMDWLSANLYRDCGFNLVYPQIFPHHCRGSDEANRATVAWGRDRTGRWLQVLDEHFIGPRSSFVCLDRLTLADYLGAGLVTVADVIGQDFDRYPNIARWLDGMRSLPNWSRVNEGFNGMVDAYRGQTFISV